MYPFVTWHDSCIEVIASTSITGCFQDVPAFCRLHLTMSQHLYSASQDTPALCQYFSKCLNSLIDYFSKNFHKL